MIQLLFIFSLIVLLVSICLAIITILAAKRRVLLRKGDPYLIRYSLIKNRFFSVKIHHVLKSDDARMHTHPWNYISIILKGGYIEQSIKRDVTGKYNTEYVRNKFYKPGCILFRRAHLPHRLMLPEENTSCWILVLTFRKKRDWGFINSSGREESYSTGMDY